MDRTMAKVEQFYLFKTRHTDIEKNYYDTVTGLCLYKDLYLCLFMFHKLTLYVYPSHFPLQIGLHENDNYEKILSVIKDVSSEGKYS